MTTVGVVVIVGVSGIVVPVMKMINVLTLSKQNVLSNTRVSEYGTPNSNPEEGSLLSS